MRIQTFSIVVGTRACNARCPFCVSRMTGFEKVSQPGAINTLNLDKAILFAERSGATTVLLTGKGEPTLYPTQITKYLSKVENKFPFIELQTNGLEIGKLIDNVSAVLTHADLARWHNHGLDTIALSVVGVDEASNMEVYDRHYPDLSRTISYLHEKGFSVRLCVMAMRGGVDSVDKLKEVVTFCQSNKVEQLTIRAIAKPSAKSSSLEVSSFVSEHQLRQTQVAAMEDWVRLKGTHLLTLMHGGQVYDVDGQNVCIGNCLTRQPGSDDIRTLIFYGDGTLTYDWQYDGAILLGGTK